MKKETSPIRNSISRSPRQCGMVAGLLITLTLACFGLSPHARAVCQEGCLGDQNTVLGNDALRNLGDLGVANTATGYLALEGNTDGSYNTGIGAFALQFNTTGIENTAIGYGALAFNTTGQYNTASGRSALVTNTTGSKNTASGYLALYNNTTGNNNTANGDHALFHNVTGRNNIAVGNGAGFNLTTGRNNIDIGNDGVRDESNTIRIGTVGTQNATFIAGISGATVPTGVAVIIDADGHLGTTTSSARFKEAVKPMDKASEAILALKPVAFHYKQEIDPESIPQFGLVAEEVEKVNPDLVARDSDGKAYTVRYEAVNAMLLNEFLKEHRRVESLEKAMAEQQKENAAMGAILKEQAAQIEQVIAQLAAASPSAGGLELSRPAPQTVARNY